VTERDDDLLTIKDLARLLRVCTATVYKLVERCHIPHFRVLNSIRFRRGDVTRFIKGDRRLSTASTDAPTEPPSPSCSTRQ